MVHIFDTALFVCNLMQVYTARRSLDFIEQLLSEAAAYVVSYY